MTIDELNISEKVIVRQWICPLYFITLKQQQHIDALLFISHSLSSFQLAQTDTHLTQLLGNLS